MTNLKISEAIRVLLICPQCKAKLYLTNGQIICENTECQVHYPVINNIPILINEKNSIFTLEDFTSQRDTTFNRKRNKLREKLRQFIPNIGNNFRAKQNYSKYVDLLLSKVPNPKVLVIGGSIIGQGMQLLTLNHSIELVETDVSFGPRTKLICDAHDIPFADESFDGVIIQAVLEHVIDPHRCVEEIYRVIKKQGLVYAETPFMQQIHMGRFDFMRFTHLGHRRLFRKFAEIDSGAVGGPGMALAWSYQYFLLSFTSSNKLRALIKVFSCLTSFYLKYFDYYLINKPGSFDASSGYYFMGRKDNNILTDKELLKLYKGAF